MRAFKAASAHLVQQDNHTGFAWQRNYYEHVVRDEDDLNRIRRYTQMNPLLRSFDAENPEKSDALDERAL